MRDEFVGGRRNLEREIWVQTDKARKRCVWVIQMVLLFVRNAMRLHALACIYLNTHTLPHLVNNAAAALHGHGPGPRK